MKLYLITLILTAIALYAYVKKSYKYASIQDEVERQSIMKTHKHTKITSRGFQEWGDVE